jgi:hypothetical protein
VADASGNGRTATATAQVTRNATSLLASDPDPSANFTGSTGSRVSVPFGSWLNSASFSVECWILPFTLADPMDLVTQDDDASPASELHFRLLISGTPKKIAGYIVGGGTLQVVVGATTIATSTTYHIVLTYDDTSKTYSIYVNGVLDGTTTVTGSVNVASTQGMFFGALSARNIERFNGLMDEVAYYGTALSATRVAAHYAAR